MRNQIPWVSISPTWSLDGLQGPPVAVLKTTAVNDGSLRVFDGLVVVDDGSVVLSGFWSPKNWRGVISTHAGKIHEPTIVKGFHRCSFGNTFGVKHW